MVALLAAAVVACTSAALTLPATTMTGDGMENNLGTGTTTALAVDPNAASSETAADSSTPESVAPAVEESAPQSAPETTEESEPAESETVSDPAAQTEETAALPQGAEVPANYTQPYTFHDEENGFTVTVWAPEGAFNEEVTLKAKLLDETDSAYAEAKQELDEKAAEEPALLSEDGETPDYGFAALDIHFENAAGEEIEPTGEVYVAIDADKLLPEDADPDSVMVQHHAEQDNGDVTVETVADTADETDGKIETTAASDDTANVQAAFEVNQFSTFTITWEVGIDLGSINVVAATIEDGTIVPISTEPLSDNVDIGAIYNGVAVSDIKVPEISGYTYTKTAYINNINTTVSKIQYTLKDWGKWQYKQNDWSEWKDVGNGTIYFIYEKDSSTPGGGQGGNPGGTVTKEATVTTGKTAVLKNDGSGNYDLTLTVSGDRGTSEQKQPVDVLFILDKSGSMTSNRMTQLKSAVNALVNTVEGNDGIDAQYSAVAFAGDGGGNHGSTYTTDTNGNAWRDGDGIKTFVKWISADGGTNYQRAIYEGKTLLNSSRPGALTFVVFVSDGIPTYRGNYDDSGNGQDDDSGDNINAAVNEIKGMSCDYFYAIGMGSDFGTWHGQDLQGTKNLKSLANVVNATSKGDGNVYSANDTAGMTAAFNRITADITHFAAKDVTITDPLSQYADLVLTDGAPQFTITVKHGEQTCTGTVDNNGTVTFQDADGNNQTATARVSSDNRTIYLDLPDNYELEEGYTYSISTVITPSQAAKDAGMDSDAAKQTPDDNTGTHSETNPKQQGFWSNDNENAKVTYTANGEKGSKNFPKPVIQVQETETPVSIAFEKVNDDNDPLGGAVFNLYYQRAVEGGASVNVYYVDITTTAEDGTTTTSNGWYTEDEISQDSNVKIVKHEFTSSSDSDSLGNFTVSFTTDEENTSNEYYLQEVKAPDGYQLPAHDFKIALQTDGTWKPFEYGTSVSGDTSDTPWKELESDKSVQDKIVYQISNSTGVELPATGSIGTTPFATIGGPLFAVCAVGLGFGLRRRRGKEAK